MTNVNRTFKLARHWFWIAPLVLGAVFVAGGVYMVAEGRSAHDEVRDTVVQENITVSEDAPSNAGQVIDSPGAAQAQSDAILGHTLASTGGYLYADLGRFTLPEGTYVLPKGTYLTGEGDTTQDVTLAAVDADGIPINMTQDVALAAKNASDAPITGWTNNAELAAKDANGAPVANALRTTALTSAELRTSLGVAVMGFKVSDLVSGLGLFMIVIGVTHILFLAPAVYWAAELANERESGKKQAKLGGTASQAL